MTSPTTGEAIEAARRGRRARHPGRGDRRTRPRRLRSGAAGKPARAVGQAHSAVPARLRARNPGRTRPRARCAGACPDRLPRAARAVTHGRLLRFPFGEGRCPSGPGSRASHRAPASRVSALSGFDPYRGRPAGLGPVRWALGCAVAAGPHGPPGRGVPRPAGGAGAPGFGPVTGPCRPARRSPGAAGRRPR